jgi:hypothetical protein
MRFRLGLTLFSAAILSGAAYADKAAAAPAEANIQLQAIVAEGAKPMSDPVDWIVTRLSERSGVPGEVIITKTAAAPELSLAPGRYVISARRGEAKAYDKITVGSADATHVLNLDAGFMNLSMIPHAGAPTVTGNVTWEIYRYAKGAGVDESRKIAAAVAPSQRFLLPAGYYTVRARYNGTFADTVLSVAAGHQFNYTLNLYAGNVGLSAVSDNGTLDDDVTWQIVRATPDRDGKHTVVAKAVDAAPKLMLREGSYIIQARSGDLVGEAPLNIKAGNMQRIKVKLTAVDG